MFCYHWATTCGLFLEIAWKAPVKPSCRAVLGPGVNCAQAIFIEVLIATVWDMFFRLALSEKSENPYQVWVSIYSLICLIRLHQAAPDNAL
jgi:hypothetical protein